MNVSRSVATFDTMEYIILINFWKRCMCLPVGMNGGKGNVMQTATIPAHKG